MSCGRDCPDCSGGVAAGLLPAPRPVPGCPECGRPIDDHVHTFAALAAARELAADSAGTRPDAYAPDLEAAP